MYFCAPRFGPCDLIPCGQPGKPLQNLANDYPVAGIPWVQWGPNELSMVAFTRE